MARNTWGILTIGCLVVSVGADRSEAKQENPNPVVVIQVENPNRVTTPRLDLAQQFAGEMYDQAGVTLRWSHDEGLAPDRILTVVLTTSDAVPGVSGADAMGVAPTPGDGTRGTLAYVFLDTVRAFAVRYRLADAHVLACALAHEVGHLLLPPNAHRPDGVMRGGWHPALFPPRAPGLPGFPDDQARLLRLRARRR